MKQKRSEDSEQRNFFRSKRLYNINGEWFFDTREGTQYGPFLDRNKAEKELAIFLAQKINEQKDAAAARRNAHHGNQDGIAHMVEELSRYFNYLKEHGKTSTLIWAQSRLQDLMDDHREPEISSLRHEALKYAIDHE